MLHTRTNTQIEPKRSTKAVKINSPDFLYIWARRNVPFNENLENQQKFDFFSAWFEFVMRKSKLGMQFAYLNHDYVCIASCKWKFWNFTVSKIGKPKLCENSWSWKTLWLLFTEPSMFIHWRITCGRMLSTVSMSREKRFNIRPNGVVSNLAIDQSNTLEKSTSCMISALFIQPIYNKTAAA